MAETSPAYLMYPNDILSSGRVMALSPLEELWYRRALDHGWMNGGMPADAEEFAGWVGRGCTVEAAAKIIAKLYDPHKKDPAKVVQARQEKERAKLRAKTKKKSEAGKQGMASRWKNRRKHEEQKTSGDNSVITEKDFVITENNIPIPISIPISTTPNGVEKKEEEPLSAAPDPKQSKTILPLDWKPSTDLLAWTKREAPGLNVSELLEDFLDFWRDIATRDNKRTLRGWDATWRKRVKQVRDNGTNRQSYQDSNAERAIQKHDIISQIRERSEQRRNGISGGDASDSSRLIRGQLTEGDDRGGNGPIQSLEGFVV